MEAIYFTSRLQLKLLDESAAPMVLFFNEKNQTIFEPWEPAKPKNFYTMNYQVSLLVAERNLKTHSQSIRYFLFLRENPNEIIGTVNFYHIMRPPECSCKLGYKLAATAQHKGYAYEAISFLLPLVMRQYGLYRVEANIMPSNEPSIALIKRLNFNFEGINHESCEIQGQRRDHYRFSYLRKQHTLD